MIIVSKIYNCLTGIGLFCLFLALSGFVLSYFSATFHLGILLGGVGVITGFLAFVVSMLISIFRKYIKFIKYDD